MAIGLRLRFNGGTQEHYEALHTHMGIDNDPPEGLIFHPAGPPDIEELPVHHLTKP